MEFSVLTSASHMSLPEAGYGSEEGHVGSQISRGSVGRYDPWGIKATDFAITRKIRHYAAVTGVSCRKGPLVELEYGERAGALWQFLAGQRALEANGAQLQLDSMV